MSGQIFEFWNKQKAELSAEGLLSWRQLFKFQVPLGSVGACLVEPRTFNENYQLDLITDNAGKSKTSRLTAMAGDPAFEHLVTAIKHRLPPTATFTDHVFVPLTDLGLKRTYGVGARVMGTTFPRWSFLMLLYGLSFLIVPLLLAVWIQLGGRYRMATDATGLTVLRILRRRIDWAAFRSVQVTRVMQYQLGVLSGSKLRLRLTHTQGALELSMNVVEGERLLREFAARRIPVA